MQVLLQDLRFALRQIVPLVVLGVSALLLAVAGIASLVPARRALAINPIEALRSE